MILLHFMKRKKILEGYISTIRLLSIILSLLLLFIIGMNSRRIAPSFDDRIRVLFISLVSILLVSQQFRIQASFSVSLLQNEGYFITPRALDLIPAIVPLVYIVLVKNINILALIILTAIAYIVETLCFNFIQKKIDSRYIFKFRLKWSSAVKHMLRNTVPIFISSTIFQVQALLSNYFAGYFGKGYITLLSNANQIMGIFQSLFVMNLINMLYPSLVRAIKKQGKQGTKKIAVFTAMENFIVILLIWGYAVIGQDLVHLLFVRGHFTSANAHVVFRFGLILGSVLQFDVIRDMCYRGYYALGNTKKPMINSLVTVFFNVVLLVILSRTIGPISVVVAPAIGTIFSTISIIIRMYKEKISINLPLIVLSIISVNGLGFIMFSVIRKIDFFSTSILVRIGVNILIGIVTVAILSSIIFILYIIIKKYFIKKL